MSCIHNLFMTLCVDYLGTRRTIETRMTASRGRERETDRERVGVNKIFGTLCSTNKQKYIDINETAKVIWLRHIPQQHGRISLKYLCNECKVMSRWAMSVAVVTPRKTGMMNTEFSEYAITMSFSKKYCYFYWKKCTWARKIGDGDDGVDNAVEEAQIVLHRDLKKECRVFFAVKENMTVRNGSWHHVKVLNLTHRSPRHENIREINNIQAERRKKIKLKYWCSKKWDRYFFLV